ncbi:MAG: AAA family ATPase [Isosphaeraceae bacterium]|nr:AAA family ATPase [Isosphaeraceae bacterium]
MKSMIRVVLIDPCVESRQALEHLLGGFDAVQVVAACGSYPEGIAAAAVQAPEMALVVLDDDPGAALGVIQTVARSRPGAVVMAASRARDGDLILRTVRAGAREFLPLPAEPSELAEAFDRLAPVPSAEGDAPQRPSQVLAITGATGGIGCTTLAINLGAILARSPGSSVALADFDLLLGAVDACLDIIPDHTVLEVAQNIDRLDLTLLKRSLTRHASGLYVLPRPLAIEDVAKIDPEALRHVIGLLKSAFGTILIDTSKSLQASDLIAFELADTILLVVQLDPTCLRNTARLLQLFRQFEGLTEKVRVVINRAGSRDCEISPKRAEETLNLPVSWEIPNASREFAAARARGVPLEAEAPHCRAHRALLEIARTFTAPEPEGAERKRSRFGRFAASFF